MSLVCSPYSCPRIFIRNIPIVLKNACAILLSFAEACTKPQDRSERRLSAGAREFPPNREISKEFSIFRPLAALLDLVRRRLAQDRDVRGKSADRHSGVRSSWVPQPSV